VLFHLTRRGLLVQFSREANVTAVDNVWVHVADELLRYRARTTQTRAQQFSLYGRRHANQIDTIMLVEALILDGDKRVRQVAREAPERNARAELASNLADE
jgi:hypothetical protein